jgi:putative ABC transport system permease protein
MFESIWLSFRFGFRYLIKQPAATVIIILTLALGIGANTAIFSVVNTLLLHPLPFAEPDRLATIWHKYPALGMMEARVSAPGFIDYRDQNHVFEHISAMVSFNGNMTGQGDPERLQCLASSANLFQTLGLRAAYGRVFLAEEENPDRGRVVILSNGFWRRRFGGDPSVVGRTLSLNDDTFTIVGVSPADVNWLEKVDLITPLMFSPDQMSEKQRKVEFLSVIGRLKPGVSMQQAQAEFDSIANRLRVEHYESTDPGKWGIVVKPLRDQLVGQFRTSLWILQLAVALVLLIACANVASLLLARAVSRQKETAIRATLGASRGWLIGQLLAESVMTAVVGGILGLLLASWGSALIIRTILQSGNQLLSVDLEKVSVRPDGWVLLFTLVFSALTGVICGLVPALQISRQNLNDAIKEGSGRSTSSVEHRRLRGALVVFEVALAMTLMIGAGLLINSFLRLQGINPGFRTDNVLALNLNLPRQSYGQPAQVLNFHRQLHQEIRSLPGAQFVGATSHAPFSGVDLTAHLNIEGQQDPVHSQIRIITVEYFRAMSIPLLKGRAFDEQDNIEGKATAIIDETMARAYFPNEDPIGKKINYKSPREIVGVVGNVKHAGLDAKGKVQLYLPLSQNPTQIMSLVVKTASDPIQLLPEIRNVIGRIDKKLPIYSVRTMEQALDQTTARQKGFMQLMTILAGLAMLLAVLGIYGLISYTVAQRTHEIGVRIALGATPGDVFRIVVSQGAGLALIGVVIGLVVSFALSRFMTTLLFGVRFIDPLTFVATSILFIAVALLASYLPARRAVKIDPTRALHFQ